MKTAIVYFSKHHGNTKKLIDAIAEKYPVDKISIAEQPEAELEGYELIGIASGIYAGSFAKQMIKYVKNHLPPESRVFLISTSAGPKPNYEKTIRKVLDEKNCTITGSYMCLGFYTFGPTKLFGGTAKGHPTDEEIKGAVSFYEGIKAK